MLLTVGAYVRKSFGNCYVVEEPCANLDAGWPLSEGYDAINQSDLPEVNSKSHSWVL